MRGGAGSGNRSANFAVITAAVLINFLVDWLWLTPLSIIAFGIVEASVFGVLYILLVVRSTTL